MSVASLSVLATSSDDQKQKVIDLLERFLAEAKEGKYVEVFIVGRYAKGVDAEATCSHSYGRSPSFAVLEAVGFLEVFKASMIREAVE